MSTTLLLRRSNKFLYAASCRSLHLLQNSSSFFLRSFSSDSRRGGGHSDSGYSPPEPIPNRPLRSRNPHPPPNPSRPDENRNNILSRDQNDNDFLERFKLGFDANVKQPGGVGGGDNNNTNLPSDKEENISPPPVDVDDADEIFNKMKETGLIPNAVAMLDGLCKDGLVQDAMKLFGLMREKGMIPEVVIYTAVVDGFCKAHKFDDAVRIFKKMQSNGVVPNAFTYGVLIRGLCKGKRYEDAFGFSIEMLEAGHSPNLATFTGLIDGYCRERGGVEEAEKVISAMKQKGFFFEEKAVREYLDKKGPFLPLVWEAILGAVNKTSSSKRSPLF